MLPPIFFIVVGCLGLYTIFNKRADKYFITSQERWPYGVLFIGTLLIGAGSAYYHLNPNNAMLLWDRLPIGMITRAYFSAIFMEQVNCRIGLLLLGPLVVLGLLATIQWKISESLEHGDLRLYVWAQFYPISMMIIILLLFPSPYSGIYYLIESLGWYGIAKIAEFFDYGIYQLTGHLVSGHTLKHLAAALALYAVIRYLTHRKIKH